jgi:hypothetical protein
MLPIEHIRLAGAFVELLRNMGMRSCDIEAVAHQMRRHLEADAEADAREEPTRLSLEN